jgi:hypothetical protein
MQRFEYTVLVFKLVGSGKGWYEDDERLGDFTDAKVILNRYAARGWRLITHTYYAGGWGAMILERPYQPGEVVPANPPTGRGDEPTP